MLHGSINHVSITVSDLPDAMAFFGPLLRFLGYTVGPIFHDSRTNHDLTVNINEGNGTAFNVWQAEPAHASHPFEVYEPGLHHMAWNVERHEQVDGVLQLVRELGGEILDGPGEFPFGPGGYYAVYFRGPDRLKFEVVHMPIAERRARALGQLR
ncbi:MAG TPA: VOC family protein [Myxococcota bacterium]|nr:VOC family protein [Myxococcota bacterium]